MSSRSSRLASLIGDKSHRGHEPNLSSSLNGDMNHIVQVVATREWTQTKASPKARRETADWTAKTLALAETF